MDILVLGGFGIPATAPLNDALDRSRPRWAVPDQMRGPACPAAALVAA